MGTRLPEESYVIGYKREDGTLDFYAGSEDPERFPTYQDALNWSNHLNNENKQRGRAPCAKTEWRVYKRKFEAVDPVLLESR